MLVAVFCFVGTVFLLYLYIMCEYQRVPGVEDQHTAGMGCLYASILYLVLGVIFLANSLLRKRRSIVVPHDSMVSRYRRTTFLLNTANASEQYQKSKTTLTRREIIAKQNELAENKIPLVPADHLS